MANTLIKHSNIGPTVISGNTALSSADLDPINDYLLVYDASADQLKKIIVDDVKTDLSSIDQHIIPDVDITYDLGSVTNRWRDLYLSGQTIHLGDTKIQQDSTTGDVSFKDASTGEAKKIMVKELEIDDPAADSTYKTVMKKVNGAMKFVKVHRASGEEMDEAETTEFSEIKIGSVTLSTDHNGKLIIPRDTVLGDSNKSSSIPEVNLEIAPEILAIQIDAVDPGDDITWLWTWEQSTLPYARTKITNSPQISVPLYNKGTYEINNFAGVETHDELTQTHSGYFKWVDGAGTDNLIDWAGSYSTKTVTHPDINGGNPTQVQQYSFVVPDTITIPTLTLPQNIGYGVSFSTPGAFTFGADMVQHSPMQGEIMDSVAEGNNPQIGPLYRGATYTFHLDSSLSNEHPFYITTDNGSGFVAGQYVGEYTSGVTGSRNDGSTGKGTLTFTVPLDAPDTLYYQCGNHQSMRGVITIRNLEVEKNNIGNYIVYFQHTHEGHKTPIELRPIPSLVNQMCLVYDASVDQFVPQDLSTYIENTPTFKEKIKEVAGTATLIAPDGIPVVASVSIFGDSSYLPYANNKAGDIAYTEQDNTLYIWDDSAYDWKRTKARNTDEVPEGSSALYYTDARVRSVLTADDIANKSYVNTQVSNLVNAAPSTLNTLNELADALGDDPNFAATMTSNLAGKVDKINTTGKTVGSSTSIPVITYNNQGQITSASTTPITVGDGLLTVAAGSGLTGSGTFSANQSTAKTITIAHADTSSQSSVNNSGATFIQDITLDAYGHLTAIGSATISPATIGAAPVSHTHAGTTTTGSYTTHTTAYGSIQLGPMNNSYSHIYTTSGTPFYFNHNSIYANGNIVWTAGNDGPGSGLDADTVDGYHASSFHINSYSNDATANAVYADNWFRAKADTGFYFEDKGTGIRSVQSEGGQYGSVATYGNTGGWDGFSLGGRVVFMHDLGDHWGIYNDVNNEWMIYGNLNGGVELRYDNDQKIVTTPTGVNVTGKITVNGLDLPDDEGINKKIKNKHLVHSILGLWDDTERRPRTVEFF
jgi:hypothetical protein